ncbi:SPOR domain-containing protein [Corynebacterium otitidis]
MAEEKWYVDPETGEVFQGRLRGWLHRMGPYPSRAEAQRAFETARTRSQAFDEEERRWRES